MTSQCQASFRPAVVLQAQAGPGGGHVGAGTTQIPLLGPRKLGGAPCGRNLMDQGVEAGAVLPGQEMLPGKG